VERAEPGLVLRERQALEASLDFHRDTLLLKCAGLTAAQLKERPVPPSRLSLLGLVRHMIEVERWWFHAAANTEAFKHEVGRARVAVAGKRLDDVVPSHGHHPERVRNMASQGSKAAGA